MPDVMAKIAAADKPVPFVADVDRIRPKRTSVQAPAVSAAAAPIAPTCTLPPSSLLIVAVNGNSVRDAERNEPMPDMDNPIDDMSDDGDNGFEDDSFEDNQEDIDSQCCRIFSTC